MKQYASFREYENDRLPTTASKKREAAESKDKKSIASLIADRAVKKASESLSALSHR